MLDGWEDVEGVVHHQGLSYVPEIIRTKLTTERTRELVAKKYYRDLQLLPIPTHCRKGTSYDSILVIVGRLTKMLCVKSVQIPIDAPWFPDLIVSDKDSFFTSKFWCPRYHFQAWLRIYAFDLNCGCRPHGSYKEDIGPRSRFN